ncbi:MAG TPA: hypothetical protein VMZ66_07785 [Aeromicrobium sp.]|nr:hypothetical protein [Aeromicrobium sp.]
MHPLYLTARVQQPDVIGSWPACWLIGGYGDGHVRPLPRPPEIDILESQYDGVGHNANMVHTAVVTTPYSWADAPQGPVSNTYTHPQLNGNWFVATESLKGRWMEIALEWYPDRACWYLDGLKIRCSNYKWLAAGGAANTTPVRAAQLRRRRLVGRLRCRHVEAADRVLRRGLRPDLPEVTIPPGDSALVLSARANP